MSLQQVELTVRRPGHPERRIPLTQGVNHLGRADTNDVVLSDIGVSRRHARIVIDDDTVFIEDLGSGNGTFFRGERIQQQPVRNGDEVLVDPFVLSFAIQQEESTNAEGLTGELEDVGDEDTVEVPSDPTLPPSPRNLEPKRRARLTTLIGQRLAPSYGVRTEGLTIGRSEARDVILFDPAASRNHAILEFVGDDVWLRDHGSGNGTFVNGSRVREQCLRHGDRLRVGGTEFRFELIGAEASEPPTLPPRPQELRVARTDLDAQPMTAQPRTAQPRTAQPAPRVPTPRGPRVVAMAAMGGFVVVLLMILGGLLAMYVMEPDASTSVASLDSQGRPKVAVPAAAKGPLSKHLRRGQRHFDSGSYLKAASQYYAALKLVPGEAEAEKMGALSTEYLMLDTMKHGLVLRSLSGSEQQSRRSSALRLARRAIAGRADKAQAVAALTDVLIFLPEDARVQGLLAKLHP